MEEKNIFVSLILSLNNGWAIWLIFKVLITIVGTALFFLVYYWISTSSMSAKDRDGVLLIELCGWVYLVSFNLFSIISWSGTVVGQMN
ncbi:MAG: hypothetical protein KAW09_00655 [Thermoplasmata archaeon]|nr:hypothetical protein [Thermoplasmata archaeon]